MNSVSSSPVQPSRASCSHTASSPPPAVLLFADSDSRTLELARRLQDRGVTSERATAQLLAAVRPGANNVSVAVVVAPPGGQADAALLAELSRRNTPTLVWGGAAGPADPAAETARWLEASVPVDEVVGCIRTLAQCAPRIRKLEVEVDQYQRIGQHLNRYFGEIDQEMRLAGRLQRDFLPRHLTELPGVTLGAVYRPASWVSGDLYDAFVIDEEHIGVLVADAMGHGVAAGLMTMFLRHTLIARRQASEGGQARSPALVLRELHESLCRQKLPNCQFVTAAYGILNHRTQEFRLARAGHPCPLLIRSGRATEEIQEIPVTGGLLGLADVPPEFSEASLVLRPGDKVLFYTDGMEEIMTLPRRTRDEPTTFSAQLREWSRLSVPDLARAVDDYLDRQAGSLHPGDDVTLLALEVSGFRPVAPRRAAR
jgi:sigma-B regulation protein RsbU (phosphoserine phosphatase)